MVRESGSVAERYARSLPVELLPDTSQLGRRERTRRELLHAGLFLIAEECTDVSVLEITRTAGVGQGTFYNHFADKGTFFRDALEYGVDIVADMIDRVVSPGGGHAQQCCQAFRVIGRLHRQVPTLSLALIRRGSEFYTDSSSLAVRVREDIVKGVEAGEFHVRDVEGATGTMLGAILMLGQRIHNHPEESDGAVADAVSGDLLQLLGVPGERIEELLALPVPLLEL
ncbi:MAG TPA: TetR/AcrR family transcriptional regulator [Dietzia timorensis]|uniref:TetR/AcrR family transcriptional regulator n=1 Tax=Dietzia timorensis TaxID=499555 RepID=A0A921F4H4_9ACTN|nr:TetR/AcrR family transcriptional regulator [Dietzia timorensis]HJE91087.1 TetR/AcrR family transcriptional regulator [Dietzia timorensis]